MDGTFFSAPHIIFYQFYSIYAVKYSNVLPTIYALLSNKSEETYTRFFHAIFKLRPDLKPKTVMIDFELVTINAIKKVFSGSPILKGCFLHISQVIWRNIQNTGLVTRYSNDPDFA